MAPIIRLQQTLQDPGSSPVRRLADGQFLALRGTVDDAYQATVSRENAMVSLLLSMCLPGMQSLEFPRPILF